MSSYFWSFEKDSEVYTNGCNSIKMCIEEAKEHNRFNVKHGDEPKEIVYIGKAIPYKTPSVDAENIMECFREVAYDDCGEASEGWLLNHTKDQEIELENRLTEVMRNWIKETNQEPTFCTFEWIKAYVIENGKELSEV